MQHVYPDVIIVEGRGTRDMSREMRDSGSDDDKGRDKATLSECCSDESASLKDYTFMYKTHGQVPAETDAASDISSVSSSIVDYVRRSLSEVHAAESRDPPPLPVKTTTQRRAPALHCDIAAAVRQDDVITSTWEPTHMTWDEVCHRHTHSLNTPLRPLYFTSFMSNFTYSPLHSLLMRSNTHSAFVLRLHRRLAVRNV